MAMQNEQFSDISHKNEMQQPAFVHQNQRKASANRLGLWYRLSLPTDPGASASIKELERFRRARTASQLFLIIAFILICAIPAGLFSDNTGIVTTVSVSLVVVVIATWLNKRGYVTAAGMLIVVTYIVGPTKDLATTPGGNSVLSLAALYLFVIPLIIAASILPRIFVICIAALNCILIPVIVVFFPHTVEITDAIKTHFPELIAIPMFLQILIAVVTVIWVDGANRALARADRAEEISRLQSDLSRRALESVEQKRQLEESLQYITETHQRFANGDLGARVSLTGDNVLWQVSGLLNNLLSRFQHLRLSSLENERIVKLLQQENSRLFQTLRSESTRRAIEGRQQSFSQPPQQSFQSYQQPAPPLSRQRSGMAYNPYSNPGLDTH